MQRCTPIIEPLENRQLLSAYFIDAATGSDANSGRSSRLPWQTLAAVSTHPFHRGDAIYLTGTFTNQTLVLGTNATGVSVNSYVPVGPRSIVKPGVYGAAVLSGEQADGIDITTSNITIQNIIITADPSVVASGNYNYGIYLHNSTAVPLTHETINHVSASGFSYSGLCMQGWNGSTANSAAFSNVLIENSSFYSNQVSGVFVGAGDDTGNEFQPAFPADFYEDSRLTIKNVQAYNNPGFNAALTGTPDGVNINQGNYTSGGIFISSVNGATVQNCTVWNNCYAALGSVGLWCFDATRVIFQSDEAYDTQTLGGDGDGFDFDHGTTHSLMQYDYSHGNAGAGFLLATTGGTSNNDGDTIRYCVADDNPSGIAVLTAVPVFHANIYNNTLLQSTGAAVVIAGDLTGTESVNFLDNIFYSAADDPLVLMGTISEPAMRFERNDYWIAATPGTVNLEFNGSNYSSITSWSAAMGVNFETLNGQIIALNQDPMLFSETPSDLPKAQVTSLALSPKSPLKTEGFVLNTRPWAGSTPYNADAPYNLAGAAWGGLGPVNFFGRPLNRRAIGAG